MHSGKSSLPIAWKWWRWWKQIYVFLATAPTGVLTAAKLWSILAQWSRRGVFSKKMEIEFALLLDSLDPYGSRKNEIRLCWGCLVLFRGASKWHSFILLCKNDPLYIFSKSNEEDRVETLTLTCLTNLANLDIDTYVCDAFFCGNAYFYRNATIKMAKSVFYATPT